MRLSLVSPTFPPKICGVGDHSWFLAEALARLGHEVTVHTQQPGPAEAPAGVRLVAGPDCLNPGAWLASQPQAVLVQFTPYLYGSSRGLAPRLLGALRRARRLRGPGTRLVLLAHELHFPVQLSLPGLLVGPLQKTQFALLGAASDRVIFTYGAPASRRDPARHGWLPVGSNIPDRGEGSPRNQLLHFGGAHPTHLYGHVRACAERIGDGWKVLCVGVEREELARLAGEHPRLEAGGRLSAAAVSRALRESTLVLAPFLDGISTRRGSAMAAFAHGRPVLTTRGASTDPSLPWDTFAAFGDALDPAAYAREAERLLADPAALARLGSAGAQAYGERFAWDRVAAGLLAQISS